MVVETIELNGEKIQIEYLASYGGTFRAQFDEQTFESKTREDLAAQLERQAKKQRERKAVDVTVLNLIPNTESNRRYTYDSGPYQTGRGAVQAKFRGHHSRSSKWLLRSDEGKAFDWSGYNRGSDQATLCRRLTDDEIEQYLELAKAADAAESALEAWLQGVRVDPEELGFTK